mgnify:CR=1 FL=1
MDKPSPKYCASSDLYFTVENINILYQIADKNNIPHNKEQMYCPKCGELLADVKYKPNGADVYNKSQKKIEIDTLRRIFQGPKASPR